MRRVIMESPYAGDVEANVAYARACLRDCIQRGEAPLASHLLYTQPGVLDDNDEEERRQGIEAGLVWREVTEAGVFYVDRGWSQGMLFAKDCYEADGIAIEERTLPGYDDDWIDISQLGSPFEQRMTPARLRYQHRRRGDTEWIDGRPKWPVA